MTIQLLSSCNNTQTNFSTDIAAPVSVEEIKLNSISDIFATTGTVIASQEITYSSEMDGDYQLQKNPRTGQLFKMGDQVRKGETIIKLLDKEYENTNDIEGAKLDYEISEMEYNKQKALYEKGGVTLRELVDSERSFISARLSLENSQIALDKMKISASFDGIITSLPYFSQGLRVVSSTELLIIMNYDHLVLDMEFTENMISKLKIGQDVFIMNYTVLNDTLTGTISQLSPAIDNSSRTFAGRIDVINSSGILRPGMFVSCEIELQQKDSVIVIPKELLLTEGNQKLVFIAERETAQMRRVKTGIENNGNIEISEGLNPGERLIVKGYETLSNRTKIKIIN